MLTDTLILGATGFIGRPLAASLPGARCLGRDELDLSDAGALRDALRALRPRRVFNLAGYGARPGQDDDAAMRTLNAELPARLREGLAALGGPRLLVQAGSIAEEGDSAYGRSKAAGIRAALSGELDGELDGELCVVVVRLFQVYGTGEAEGRLLPSLQALARGARSPPLTLGDPDQRRDWTWVGDVASVLAQLGDERRSGLVELGTGRLRTVGEVVALASARLGLGPTSVAWGQRAETRLPVPARPADLSALRERLGPLDLRSLEEGLARTLGEPAGRVP